MITQQMRYRNNKISKHQLDLLNSIGFVWDARALIADQKWMVTYQRLIAYNKQHHTTSVPRSYQEDHQLAIWVTIQRQYYQNNDLLVERIRYLESLGFVWKMRDLVPWIFYYKLENRALYRES